MTCNKLKTKERRSKIGKILQTVKKPDGKFMLCCALFFAKGQLISKGLFKGFICTKNEQKYFCISALAYKKRSNQKSSLRESK